MPIIKNVLELNEEELESFRKLYIEYFKNHCITSNIKFQVLERVKMLANAHGYANEMVRRVKEGYSTGFVYFEPNFDKDVVGLEAKGLVVGFDTDSGMNNISHLYMEAKPDDIARKIMLRELLKAYLQEVKSHGMYNVQTTGDLFDPTLNDDLAFLGFEEGSTNGTEISYGRSI